MKVSFWLLLPLVSLNLMEMKTTASPLVDNYLVYVGTYTTKASKGIYAFRYQSSTHQLTSLGLGAETVNPSFITIHPNGRYLYSVSAIPEGTVSAFRIDFATGKLILLNTKSSHGNGPCHLLVDHAGKSLFVANFRSGSVAALRIQEDGSLDEPSSFFQSEGSSIDPVKQAGPHAHSVNIPRGNQFMLTTDLGLDKVFSYRIDSAKAKLTPNEPPFIKVKAGSGPRHLGFSHDEKYVYLLNEIQSNVIAFHYDAGKGSLEEFQTISALPEHYEGESAAAEIALSPNGNFLYSSNRGYDSIAQFSIDGKTGRLSLVGQTPTAGKTPRYFEFDPSGDVLFAANQDSDSIVQFSVDPKTGKLTATGKSYSTPTPVCIKFVPIT